MFSAVRGMSNRLKGIDGNMAGEGIVLGAVAVVDKDATVQYLRLEKTGEPVDTAEVLAAVKKMLAA